MGWTNISNAAQNAACEAVVDLIDAGASNGTIVIYADDGNGVPANADTPITNQTALGTLAFSDPAYGIAGDITPGQADANAITGETSATGTGTAAWARIYDSDGAPVMDIDVGVIASGARLELDSTSIAAGGSIDVTSLSVLMPGGV